MDKFIKNLARGAGKILREGFRTKFEINHKEGIWDVVTKYDLASEDYIVSRIRRKYPHHGIISEESPQIKGKDFWLIDPLDGTRNFSRGIPFFCVSIAFVVKNKITYGAVYDPVHDEFFFAQRGKGAKLNNKRIRVGKSQLLHGAVASISGAYHASTAKISRKLYNIASEQKLWITNNASAALSTSYLANGRHDIIMRIGSMPWDYAAAALIIQEAGAKISQVDGSPYKWDSNSVVGANSILYNKIIEALKDAKI